MFILIYILACECDTGIYDTGYLVRTERLRTQDIPQMVKTKNYWQVHFNCCKVHAWLIFVLLKIEREHNYYRIMPYALLRRSSQLVRFRNIP